MKRLVLAAALGLLLPAATLAERVVAIGDVHGDYDAFIGILQTAGLIDADLHWSGGDTTFVQTGDLLDRGSRTRPVLDLMMRLQEEAPQQGGRVIALLGNHEAMNLLLQRRDVGLASYSDWATGGENRSAEFRSVAKAARKLDGLLGRQSGAGSPGHQANWLEQNPPGSLNYIRDLAADGNYGAWLRTLPAVAKVGDTIFLHGGLNETTAALPIADINTRAQWEISAADACHHHLENLGYLAESSPAGDMIQAGTAVLERFRQRNPSSLKPPEAAALGVLEQCEGYQDWFVLSESGPLWLRDYYFNADRSTGWNGDDGLEHIEAVLDLQSVEHVVVGHTPQLNGKILPRFDGRIFIIDTGMLSSFYGGNASALEIVDGTFTAIYPDGSREVLHRSEPGKTESDTAQASVVSGWSWPGRSGDPLPFSTPEEFLDFLKEAKIVDQKVIATGINSPVRYTFEADGVQARAILRTSETVWQNQQGPNGRFYRYFKDSYIYECAAYELSEALGLHMVPPTMMHRVAGKTGSLQAWVENAQREADILEQGLTPPQPGPYVKQLLGRKFFDALVNNQDRNEGNTLITADWKIWLIDHTRTFFTEEDEERIAAINQASRQIVDTMRNTDRDALTARLKPYLTPIELKALFERWDALLAHVDRIASEQGAENVFYDS